MQAQTIVGSSLDYVTFDQSTKLTSFSPMKKSVSSCVDVGCMIFYMSRC